MLFSHCPFCSLFLSVPHCLCLPGLCLCLTISASLSVTHFFVSVSGSPSLLVISLPLSVSDSFTPSVSSPGLARPLGHGVTGRQGALRLFSRPCWQGAQLGCCSGILQLPGSSHQAQPLASPPSTFCPEQGALGVGGVGMEGSRQAPVTGQPVLVALLPTSAAP